MVGRFRHWLRSLPSGRSSARRRAGQAVLVGVALCLIAVVGISCDDDSSSSPTESPSTVASPSAVASPAAATSPAVTASPSVEASGTVWLCRPGLPDNPCESSLETTVVSADL